LVGDQTSLAKWAGKTLNLDGIEIGLIPGTHIYCLQAQLSGTIEAIPVDTTLIPENETVWLAVDRTLSFVSDSLGACKMMVCQTVKL
jgi:hypothetical protein